MKSLSCPYVLDRTGRDVHAEGARLREQGGVARVELPGGVLGWSVVGYYQIKEVLADPRVSKDPRQHWPAFINKEIGMDWPMISWVMMDNMTTKYGPNHLRLRKLISKGFTPRRVEAMRPPIERIVADLLDELDNASDDVVDLKRNFAYQVPARMICDLVGVPEENRPEMLRGGEVTTDTKISPEEAEANMRHWQKMMHDLVQFKRQNPGDDLTTDLIAVQDRDGTRLSDSELAGILFLVLGAGSETVMNLLGKAVVSLLTHPDQLDLVKAGKVSWEDVIEETLRAESPIAQLPLRFAIEDIQIGDVTIRKGDPILIGFAAGNRDPARHGETSEMFDVTREDKDHLAFGHGVHFCLGAALGRLEAMIALPALFARFPDLALAVPVEELEPQGTFIMNGHLTLPVRLKARSETRQDEPQPAA
jgi:2-hydroxy-5-methyl-1-naphthoate 7-hydroxylase